MTYSYAYWVVDHDTIKFNNLNGTQDTIYSEVPKQTTV